MFYLTNAESSVTNFQAKERQFVKADVKTVVANPRRRRKHSASMIYQKVVLIKKPEVEPRSSQFDRASLHSAAP